MLACRTEIEKEEEITLFEAGNILSEVDLTESRVYSKKEGVFAVDIGTTTVAVALTDEESVVEVTTFDNPQLPFGADVLSRIQNANKFGVSKLQKPLLIELKNAVDRLCKKYKCHAEKIYASGNTVMLHLFWGEDVSSLGVAPYAPVFTGKRTGKLPLLGDADIVTLPCISSYVGADIAAGISVCPPPAPDKKNLFIDLGTNAEIALISEKEIVATSAAAGPCFEAGNVSCGMPATDGAVASFSLDGEEKKVTFLGKAAKGVCGTGLIDVIGQLVKYNIIDKTGFLTYKNGYPIYGNIILTQQDVRAFQMAKSALRSGTETLLKTTKTSYEDIENVYVAGGFSAAINVENAILAGLFSPALERKCTAVKNVALAGTVRYAAGAKEVDSVLARACAVDLASTPEFSELFIENLNFS